MIYVLFVLFMIDGQWYQIEGFGPRYQPNIEICEKRLEFLKEYLPQAYPGVKIMAGCEEVKGEDI